MNLIIKSILVVSSATIVGYLIERLLSTGTPFVMNNIHSNVELNVFWLLTFGLIYYFFMQQKLKKEISI